MSSFIDPKRGTLPPDLSRTPGTTTRAVATVLTTDAEFKGSLAFSGELQLHGRVEGTIESDGGTLTIGEEALVKAEIRVNDIIVYGKVEGNITATGRVELRGKAQVHGDLKSNRLAVEDGVIFVGRSETLSGKNEVPAEFAKLFSKLGVPRTGGSNSSHSPAPVKTENHQ